MTTTFPAWPTFSEEDAAAVAAILCSGKVNYWTGTECLEFERDFAEWVGTSHAIALNNGTVALEVALKAAGVGPGDEVVVTPRSFIASASCVPLAGAVPVFAEVDRDSGNITAGTIADVLTSRTRAVIPVHLGGMPCDMDPIMDLAQEYGLRVIEDCAQAHGARYKGRSVGSLGHIAAWSFCQDKIMTTGGEGGAVTTSDREMWSTMWSYKDHGKSWKAVHEVDHPPGFRWLHETFGTNGRMLEMQAVLGRMQLKRMDEWAETRRRNAAAIKSAAREAPGLRVPDTPEWATPAEYKTYVFIEPGALREGWSRDRVMGEIAERGVPCFSGSCSEIYLEKAFEDTPWRPRRRFPVARELGETSLMFLVHPTLRPEHIDRTRDVLRTVMREACT